MNTDARYIIWLIDFLSGKGVDTQALSAAHNLNQLTSLEVSISNVTHRALLADALRLTGDTGLGLKLGYQRSLATYDQLAYLMMSCTTLREAIERGLKYQSYPGRFSGQSIITTFSEIEGQGCFQVNVKEALGGLRLLAVEDLLSNIITTARWVLGQPLPVTRLRCDYPAPPHADDYHAIFECELQFDAPVIQLFFDAAILDQPLPITQIAVQLGYSDHSGFLKAFKKWTGMTPSEFRGRLF